MPIKIPMSILFNQPSNVRVPLGAEFSRRSILLSVELALNTNADTFGSLHAGVGFENIGQPGQLLRAYAYVHADSYVRLQLGFHPGHGSQHADSGQLAALPIKVVALEDVAKEMRTQILICLRCEIEQWP